MGQYISIVELVGLSLVFIIGYALGKTIIETIKNK